jgi:hypothetical protein
MIAKEHTFMIPHSPLFDQTTLEHLVQNDKVVQRYREFFSLIGWKPVQQYQAGCTLSDRPSHPEEAYIKAFLIKIIEGKKHMTQLRAFLVEHPLLTAELGFRLHLDPTQPYGFDIEKTLPKKRWLNAKLRSLDHCLLQDLFTGSVHALQEIIPGLGETMAVDVKHIYAWVRENNPRESIKDRFCKDRQPKGDPDCKVGVKKSTNIEQPDGSTKKEKEYLWGYGSGVAAATIGGYGDVVIAEHTLPFNEGDITYYLPLYNQAVYNLNFFPTYVTADSAYDAWYVYQSCAFHGGIAAVPLNEHGHKNARYDSDGTLSVKKVCGCILPYNLNIPTAIAHNVLFVLFSSLTQLESAVSMSNSKKAKDVARTPIVKLAARCVSHLIVPARSIRQFIDSAPVLNVSIVKPRNSALSVHLSVTSTLYAILIL